MPNTLIVNARLVNEGREFDGDLRIEDGRIAEIGTGLSARSGESVVDAAGRRLLPGMIDDQVHFREPGMEHKADMAVESGAAVAGGLTSFMDMPNTNPPTLDAAALEDKYRRAAGRVWGNHGFYMGASNDNLEAVRAIDPKATPGLKVFMGASTGNMLVDNPETLDAIFRDTPVPIITHCEDTPMIEAETARYKEKYGDDIPAACHPDIRSREACKKSTVLALSLARRHGTRRGRGDVRQARPLPHGRDCPAGPWPRREFQLPAPVAPGRAGRRLRGAGPGDRRCRRHGPCDRPAPALGHELAGRADRPAVDAGARRHAVTRPAAGVTT